MSRLAQAVPPAWPGRPIYSTAFTRSSQGSSMGPPPSRTTTVLGLALATASIMRLWPSGMAMLSRSKPSDSQLSGRPAVTTATRARQASSAARRRPASVTRPSRSQQEK